MDEWRGWVGRRATIKDSGSVKVWDIVGRDKTNPEYLRIADDGVIRSDAIHIGRLDRLPVQEDVNRRPGQEKPGARIDVPQVGPDSALEMMTHLLGMAASYFEAVADDPASRDEVQRIIQELDFQGGPRVTATMAFYDAIYAWYEKSKSDD